MACALVRAASRLVGMLGEHPRFPRFSAGHRQEWRRGTHECVRHNGTPILSAILRERLPASVFSTLLVLGLWPAKADENSGGWRALPQKP